MTKSEKFNNILKCGLKMVKNLDQVAAEQKRLQQFTKNKICFYLAERASKDPEAPSEELYNRFKKYTKQQIVLHCAIILVLEREGTYIC